MSYLHYLCLFAHNDVQHILRYVLFSFTYRLLGEFQSRKAHRVHVRDKDLMKYLCCVIIVVLGYMSVWTTVTLDHLREGKTILDTGVTPDYDIRKK
jgi:G protein-coupled receptor 158